MTAYSADCSTTVRKKITTTVRLNHLVAMPNPQMNGVLPASGHTQPRRVDTHCGWFTMSTETSTAGTVPRFSSQWVVFRSSGQPTPGP